MQCRLQCDKYFKKFKLFKNLVLDHFILKMLLWIKCLVTAEPGIWSAILANSVLLCKSLDVQSLLQFHFMNSYP